MSTDYIGSIIQPFESGKSVGFRTGQEYERRRVGQVINDRIATLRNYGELGMPNKTVSALVSELRLLATAIEEAG